MLVTLQSAVVQVFGPPTSPPPDLPFNRVPLPSPSTSRDFVPTPASCGYKLKSSPRSLTHRAGLCVVGPWCGPQQHGLSSKNMARITSGCVAMCIHEQQMALITSDCAAGRPCRRGLCFDSPQVNASDGQPAHAGQPPQPPQPATGHLLAFRSCTAALTCRHSQPIGDSARQGAFGACFANHDAELEEVAEVYCARPAGRLWVSDVPTGAVRRVLQLMPSAEEPALVGRIPTTSSGRSAHEFGRLHRLGPVRERNTCQGLSLRPLLPFRQRLMPFPAVLQLAAEGSAR